MSDKNRPDHSAKDLPAKPLKNADAEKVTGGTLPKAGTSKTGSDSVEESTGIGC